MTSKIATLLAASGALIPYSHAEMVYWRGGAATDDWNNSANWNTKYAPGSHSEENNIIFVGERSNNTPTTSFGFVTESSLNLRDEVTLTLESGVTISKFNHLRLAPNAAPKSGGHIVQTGGNLAGDSIYVASHALAKSRSTHTLSGGNVSLTGKYEVRGLGDVVLTGSSSSVNAASIFFVGKSTLTFNFDASGTGSFSTTGPFKASESSLLEINVGSYERSVGGSYTLVDASNLTGFDASNVTVNGFGEEGVGYRLTQDDGAGDIVFEVIPSSVSSVASSTVEPTISPAAALIDFSSTSIVLKGQR